MELLSTIAILNKLDENLLHNDKLNLLEKNRDKYITIHITEKKITFLGGIKKNQKSTIKEKINKEQFFVVQDDIYKINLSEKIYLFKKFDNCKSRVFIGLLIDRNSDNRLDLMNIQSNYLLNNMI